ncbi:MAG: hypothetical protein GF408_04680 [Candidatus Omnitrophica bacterium]|nr:hypothetical protein [Candidatus Omnitrophota bacterium]
MLLPDADKEKVEKFFIAEAGKEMEKGVVFKAVPSMEKGFRIGKKGSNAYYDFTEDAITEAFRTLLNPRIADLLGKGTKRDE